MKKIALFHTLLTVVIFVSLSGSSVAQTPSPTNVQPNLFAGVRYEPSQPLHPRSKPLFDPKNPPAIRTFSVSFYGAKEPVPSLLTLPASGKAPVPCILLLHGLGGNKAQVQPLAVALARRGYASLAIDIAGHGERPPIRVGETGKVIRQNDAQSAAANFSPITLRLAAAETVVDLRRAVDYLQTRRDIDGKRIGLVGVSLGGILGGLAMAVEPRIHAATLWAAGGNWGRMIGESELSVAKQVRAKGYDADRTEAEMADVDPARLIANAAPRPLFFINGDHDTTVPRACGDILYAAAAQPKERLLLPGGHIPDLDTMITQTLNWLDRNLKKPRS